MLHNKVYSALNIAGLAAGRLWRCLSVYGYTASMPMTAFLPDYNQFVRVKLNFYHSGEIQTQRGSSVPLVEEFRKNYPR